MNYVHMEIRKTNLLFIHGLASTAAFVLDLFASFTVTTLFLRGDGHIPINMMTWCR